MKANNAKILFIEIVSSLKVNTNMKKYLYLIAFATAILISCGKANSGVPEAQGGLLPTNYVYIRDSGFIPKNTTVVNGNSITFVNQTSTSQGIYSIDSMFINKQGIAENTSYYFKKDKIGSISFFLAGKPATNGTITYTP